MTGGLAVLMRANEYALLAGKLRARSDAEGGLKGFLRLADRYSHESRVLFSNRAAGVSRSAAANQNGRPSGPFQVGDDLVGQAPAITSANG